MHMSFFGTNMLKCKAIEHHQKLSAHTHIGGALIKAQLAQ